ncbi:hypothetical protein I8H84_05530 [Candidatus Saccharibacteria bacterium]|nr:hypothetical protein [Candidatus Saccharibacteria bacterium]MBH1973202.1 hypothetical protein [Candidatus Saccharibacteria bacterium]MBH1990557.1 hypothetical protein [Candidatus Saccharibacteria bacterium]
MATGLFTVLNGQSAYADTATDACNKLGYSNQGGDKDWLKACEYGYRNNAGKSASEIQKLCEAAGYKDTNGNRAACSVGSGLPGNTQLSSGAEAACKSVGYYSNALQECINSYNKNGGKTESQVLAACKAKGNTCYVGAQLKGIAADVVDPNSKEACDAKGGSFRLTSKGATGPQDVWTCLSKDDGAKYDKCIAMGAEWKGSICKDTKESCEKRGGTMQTVTVDQNSANAGKQECSVEMPADVNPASPIGGEGECGGAKVNLLSCSGSGEEAIGGILKLVLTIMSVGVGILAVGGIVYGAILYASAQDNAGQTKKAVEVITNTVIGLLLYGLMIAIVNWLIPGGVIG